MISEAQFDPDRWKSMGLFKEEIRKNYVFRGTGNESKDWVILSEKKICLQLTAAFNCLFSIGIFHTSALIPRTIIAMRMIVIK